MGGLALAFALTWALGVEGHNGALATAVAAAAVVLP